MDAIKTALKPVVKQALRDGGAAIGGYAMGRPGMIFGQELGGKLSRLIGSGDYMTNVSSNDLMSPVNLLPSSSFGPQEDMVVITRREFLGDVLAPSVAGTFTNYSYPINAGLLNSFPFLSKIASNYEEYCFDGLVYEFISSASPYIANSALGTVIAAMEYNSAAPAFTTKYSMENSAHAVSTRLDKNLLYGVECAKGSNPQNCYYVRSGTSSLPLTTTDLGFFQIAIAPSTTVPTGTVLGELWVTYKVCLKRPILDLNRYATFHILRSSCDLSNPFGTTTTKSTSYGASVWNGITSTTLSFSGAVVGDIWRMSFIFTGSVGAAGAITNGGLVTGANGIVAYNGWANGLASFRTAGGLNASTTFIVEYLFQMTATSGTVTHITAGNANWPTGTTSTEMYLDFVGNNISVSSF